MTRKVTPAQFLELAGYLRTLAEATRKPRSAAGVSWVEGSLAAREAALTTYDDAWGHLPLREAWLATQGLIAHTADHLHGMACTIEGRGTVLATASLLRPTLQSAAIAYDLADPRIDERERLRRSMNLRLLSLTEQLNIASAYPDEQVQLRVQINTIKVSAERQGFHWMRARRTPVGVTKPVWLEPRSESDQRLLGRLLDQQPGNSTAALVHRLSSAVIHGQAHGMSAFWMREGVQMGSDGIGTIPLGASLPWLAALTGSVVIGTHRLMLRMCETQAGTSKLGAASHSQR